VEEQEKEERERGVTDTWVAAELPEQTTFYVSFISLLNLSMPSWHPSPHSALSLGLIYPGNPASLGS
jgi:hypothetical protein